MTSLLIIGAGPLQLPAYLAAKKRGLRVIGVDKNPQAVGLAHADVAENVDTRDVEGILRVARREQIGGVLTLCTDMPVIGVARVAAELQLPALSPAAAERATDKALMRVTLNSQGAPVPRFFVVQTVSEALEIVQALEFPVIVKPTKSSGSRGVTTVRAIEHLAAAVARAQTQNSGMAVLIEEFIDGPEVSVESISVGKTHHIVAITDKRTTGEPHWVEVGHVQPCRLSHDVQEQIKAATVASLDALGIRDAAGHTEIKIGAHGPKIMEIGARLGGDYITTELTPRSTGVDMVEAIIDLALGRTPTITPLKKQGAAICYLTSRPGRIRAIAGVEDAQQVPGVCRIEIHAKEGEDIRPILSSLDRPGFVICEGDNAQQAEERAKNAAAKVEFVLEG